MIQSHLQKLWPRTCASLLAMAVIYGLTSAAFAGDAAAAGTAPAKKTAKPAAKKLTGAELYAINCNRCHPERYPTEWRSTEWKTLMTHMRVRANVPAKQAKEILKYLQEDSGN